MQPSSQLSRAVQHGADDALRVVMLSQLRSVGLDRLARVLHVAAGRPELLADLFDGRARSAAGELGLSDSAVQHLRSGRRLIEQRSRTIVDRFQQLGVAVLWPGHPDYPRTLLEQEGDGLPPLLFCAGDPTLLQRPKAAVINSHKSERLDPRARWVEITLALFEQLGKRKYCLLSGSDLRHYDLPRFKAVKDQAAVIHVLDTDLLHWHDAKQSHDGTLVVTAIPPQQGPRPRAARMQLRDRLLLALADVAVAVEVRKGGVMEREGLAALKRGRRLAVARLAPFTTATAGNKTLLGSGAQPFTPDATGESLDRLLGAPPSAAAQPAEDTVARRQRLGQFFTPPEVAAFTWDVVEMLLPKPKHGGASRLAIDPAVGEGVFLRAALERGWPADHLIGVDTDATLETAWSRLFAEQPEIGLHVADGLLDHPWLGIGPDQFDVVIGNPPFGGEGLRRLELLLTPPKPDRAARQQSLFGGGEVQEPQADLWESQRQAVREQAPALEQLARAVVRQYESWRLSRVTTAEIESGDEVESNAENGNGSDTLPGITVKRGADRVRQIAEEFNIDQLIFRWGAPLSSKEIATLKRLSTFPIEILFAERFVQLCKPNGIVAAVLPDGIFASAKTLPFRNWLMERTELKAVISLPQELFTGVGAKAKTSILFLRKYTQRERQEVLALKEQSAAPCVPHPKTLTRRVLLTSQGSAAAQVPLDVYLSDAKRALLDLGRGQSDR